MRELWLIRHGETDWNLTGRIQGASDIPLNATGIAQAESLVGRLENESFDAVYSSDLDRAHTTCTTALPGADVRPDVRLRELAYGVLEGKRWAELDDDLAAAVREWQEDPVTRRIPGGESYGDLTARVQAFVESLPAEGRFAAFAHGGTIRSALYAILGPPNGSGWRVAIENCSMTRLRFDSRGVTVLTVNDCGHLTRVR